MPTDSRLTILIFGLVVLLGGSALYGGLKLSGISEAQAQSGASILLLLGLVAWTAGYLRRVVTGQMSFHQQKQAFETEQIRQVLEQMSPEELDALQQEIEAEVAEETPSSPQENHSSQSPTV